MANDTLHGVDLVIDENGKAALVPNQESGQASPEQQAFADVLRTAIDSTSNIGLTVSRNDSEAVVGSLV